ncbi:glycosyltransferase [Pseudarthrobacter sp. NamB4]|nr:glycosyltransferase [Pseudarthrobacter sp. NamB4]
MSVGAVNKSTGRSKAMVMITAVLPCAKPDNAGGRYVQWVVQAAAKYYEVFAIAPDGPVSHRAMEAGGVPRHKLFGGSPPASAAAWDQAVVRMLGIAAPVLPPWRFLAGLLRDQGTLDAIRRADVIDLQWEEYGVLIPFLRRLNPGAQIVCTFHDVLSQRYRRASEAATSFAPRVRWAWAAALARRSERKMLRQADKIVVLSQKDAGLLPPGTAEVHVITPPLAVGMGEIDRSAPVAGEVLFVGFLARWENEEGLLWFLSAVWPRIKTAVPAARLQVAGLGIRSTVSEAAREAGVELLGFVPDLEPLYERASVVVVPVRLGAGVKFKVVDALVAGVPVVTTTVGAEGIGDRSWFAGMHDDAEEFANAVLRVLREPAGAGCHSAEVREEALRVYGWEQFDDAMFHVYGSLLLESTKKPEKGAL